MPAPARHFYDFGSFRVDPQRHRLLHNNEPIHLPPKSFDTLLVLVQNPGQLLEREDLLKAVWAEAFVEDANLTVAVSTLRKALSRDAQDGGYIETVPRVGYRFLADVRIVSDELKPVIVEKHTLSRKVIEEEVMEFPSHSTSEIVTSLGSFASSRLSQVLAAATVMVLAVTALVYVRRFDFHSAFASSTSVSKIKSIVVLPPRFIGTTGSDPSLSIGVADALITRLGGIRDLSVRPTSASARYLNSNQDPVDVGRALGVDAVLEGSLQREAGRVRITLRMLNVSTATQVWSANFDESDQDIFKLEDSLAQQVAVQLFGQLSKPERERLARQQTHNPEAYASYVQGMFFWSRRGDQVTNALPYFRRAIELDPNFAEAYVGLANINATQQIPSPEAETLIDRALQLNDDLAEAHATKALIKMFHHWDWQAAETELDKSIALNPNSVSAHHWKGVYLSLRGRLEQAQGELHYALNLDPTSPILLADIGQLHYLARQYDQAAEYCNRALALDPQSQMSHFYLFDIYLAKGMEQEALRHLALSEGLESSVTRRVADRYAQQGLEATVNERLKLFLSRKPEEQLVLALRISRCYLLLKNQDEAIKWLERIPERPNFFDPYIAVDPFFDPLRSNPRFQAVVHRMGLN